MSKEMNMRRYFQLMSGFLNCSLMAVIIFLMFNSEKDFNLRSPCIAPPPSVRNKAMQTEQRDANNIEKQLVFQRNTISMKLNQQQKKIGELQCKMKDNTNDRGAYCYEEAMAQLKIGETGQLVFEEIAKAVKGQTVASFGEGAGLHAKRMITTGLPARVDSYDGNPFCNETTGGRVQFLDLSVEQYGLPVYDWIISIEVAEHIPPEYEHVFLDNIARHARQGVVISWAVPGQPGVGHINCRPFEYVKQTMGEFGFDHDILMTNRFKKVSEGYLKNNLNAFVRATNKPLMNIFS